MAQTLSIAACQFALRPVCSFAEFAEHARELLDGARGADLVLLPELFTIELFTSFPGWKQASLADLGRIDEYTPQYRDLFAAEARKRRQVILAGSHLVREGGRTTNVAHLLGQLDELLITEWLQILGRRYRWQDWLHLGHP